ncbi:MAG: acyl-CoA dehydrogenase family protein [Dehalococcoidia bacterium]
MDFGFSEGEKAFRQEVAEFLDRELTPDILREVEERGLPGPLYFQFQRRLGAKGWLGLTWPREYGGQARSPIERFIFIEELALRGVEYRNLAESIVGPTLILYGTEDLKKEFLPRIARGEVVFCLLYSEPHAGSDLASLEIRAQARDDGYVLNGQKLYSSEADLADYGWLAARTDPEAPKHRRISIFITKMSAPGITVRPLISMAGDRRFNEVYFDDVRVDKRFRVGEENRGWYYVATALDFERATAGAAAFVGTMQCALQELVDYVKNTRYGGRSLAQNPLIRHELAQRAIELEAMRTLSYRVLWLLSQGQVPNYEASAIKLYGSELAQRVAQTASTILGLYGQLAPGSPRAPFEGKMARFSLRSVSDTIRGGTSEIQRNIIAQRGLGLPPG